MKTGTKRVKIKIPPLGRPAHLPKIARARIRGPRNLDPVLLRRAVRAVIRERLIREARQAAAKKK